MLVLVEFIVDFRKNAFKIRGLETRHPKINFVLVIKCCPILREEGGLDRCVTGRGIGGKSPRRKIFFKLLGFKEKNPQKIGSRDM